MKITKARVISGLLTTTPLDGFGQSLLLEEPSGLMRSSEPCNHKQFVKTFP